MIAWIISAVVAVACIFVSVRQQFTKTSKVPEPPAELVAALRRVRAPREATAVTQRLPETHPVRSLVEAAATSGTREQGIANLNEIMLELATLLSDAGTVPRAAGRIAFFAAACLAIIELARTLPGGRPALSSVMSIAATGLCGAVACGLMARRLDRTSRLLRGRYDELARVLERLLDARFGK